MSDLIHYAPIIVRSSVPTDWERKFLASIIAKTRKGKVLTERQGEVLGKIVDKFKAATMRQDDEVIDAQ